MGKALEMGKTSALGSFHLLIGVAGSSVIMFFGTFILNTLLSVPDVGLYGLALIPSSIINYFRDWGVNFAMTQQIASLRAAGKDPEIHDVILSGIVFEILTGVILSVICFAVAEPLALLLSPSNAVVAANLSVFISIMSISIFAGALFSAATAIFTGFERMKLNSFVQILQAIVKTALGPFLVIVGFGVLGAIYGALAFFVTGGVVGVVLVYFLFFRSLRKCKVGKCDVKATLKPMLRYGLPLTFSSTVVGVLPQVFAFTMAIYAGKGDVLAGYPSTWMMGNYFTSVNFSVLLTFISIPIATALFPSFSKLNPEKNPELMKTVFVSSTKYSSLLLVPATMLIITLAVPIVNFIFPVGGIVHNLWVVDAVPKFPYAALFLAVSSIINLLVLFGNISLGSFQQGIGKTGQMMKQSVLSLVVGLPVAYLLVAFFYSLGGSNGQASASFAVIGGLLGILIETTPAIAWGLYWSWRKYRVKPDFLVSAKIFGSSFVASAVTYLSVSFLSLPYVVKLVGGFLIFLAVYMVAAPVTGAVNKADIDNLKSMFSGLGVISKILDLPLLFMGKIAKNGNSKKTPVYDS